MDSRCTQVLGTLKADKKPDGKWTEAQRLFYDYRRLGKCADKVYRHAFAIYENTVQREIMEALLLAEADPEQIDDIFGIPAVATAVYHELFFDTARFLSRLDKIGYVETYPEGFGRELKLRALHLGADFVFFRFANIVPKTDTQRNLVKKMFMASAYRAMESNFNPLNSKVSKAATDHAKIMLKSYECIERLMQEDASDSADLLKVLTRRELEAPKIDNGGIAPEEIV